MLLVCVSLVDKAERNERERTVQFVSPESEEYQSGTPEVTRYQEVVPLKLRPNRQRTTGYGPSETRPKRFGATVVSDVLICGDHPCLLYFLYRLRSKESYW